MPMITPARRLVAGLATLIFAAACAPRAVQASVQPCGGVPQITDVAGDGHHASSDVLSAWWSESAGRVQANITVQVASWTPEHDDAEIIGSGFAVVFRAAGQTRFVRATAPAAGPMLFDYGTYSAAGGFAPAGATTGAAVPNVLAGTVSIDLPDAFGIAAGTALTDPFVLTYDGINAGLPAWVDHAPGGTTPTDPARGADYVVGSCSTATPGTPGGPSGQTTGAPGGTGGATTNAAVTAVRLKAPASITGGGRVPVTGAIVPARGGVEVAITRRARTTAITRVRTAADGSFRATVPIGETTRLRAAAGGLSSQELQVLVRSRVRIAVRRLRSGLTRVTGVVRPALPGRVLLLRTTSITPSATASVTGSTFTFRLRNAIRGRYQAVYIPSGARAERSTSNTGVIR